MPDLITPDARYELDIGKLIKKLIDKYPQDEVRWLLQIARSKASETRREHGDSGLDAAGWLCVGIMKASKDQPQWFADVAQIILGWRKYNNVHGGNKVQWGVPPSWLGGQGDGWSWKADLDDTVANAIVKKAIE